MMGRFIGVVTLPIVRIEAWYCLLLDEGSGKPRGPHRLSRADQDVKSEMPLRQRQGNLWELISDRERFIRTQQVSTSQPSQRRKAQIGHIANSRVAVVGGF